MDEERQNPQDDQEKLYELYIKQDEELSKRDLSNVENLDKAILSLSSAGLGLSLAFIRNVVPLAQANHVWVLHVSWLIFVLSDYLYPTRRISSVNARLDKQREFNEKYYLEDDEDAVAADILRIGDDAFSKLCFCHYLYCCCFLYSPLHWVKFRKYPC